MGSKSHFNLQKLSSWLSALQGPDIKEGKHGGRPLCSYLEPQNTKGLIIGFDDGSIKVKGQIAKELLQEKPLQKDFCTFTQSGKTYIQQPSYTCKTCDMADPNDSICSNCIKICHAGHDLERQDYIGGSFCDCGVQGEAVCKALDQSSDLRITSISGPEQYSSFGKSRELPWSTVSLQLSSQNLFCLGDVSGQVHLLWNKKNNVIRKSQKIHNSSITGLAELDGKLVSTSLDGTIKLWNIPDPENNRNVQKNNYPNNSGTNLEYNSEESRLNLSQECRF